MFINILSLGYTESQAIDQGKFLKSILDKMFSSKDLKSDEGRTRTKTVYSLFKLIPDITSSTKSVCLGN